MTENFDLFFKIVTERLLIQFPDIDDFEFFDTYLTEDEFKNSIYLMDWDLKEHNEFKDIIKKADNQNRFIVLQAYPYNSMDRAREEGHPEKVWEYFKNDLKRLMNFYSKFGFEETSGGWMYRRPRQNVGEMTDASVYGADGAYPVDDTRTPFVMGTYSRRGKIKSKKRRKRRKNKKR